MPIKEKYKLTPGEMAIMNVLWDSPEPITQQQIIATAKEQGIQVFKDRSAFTLTRSLLAKKMIREDGFVRAGKTYARQFTPNISRSQYYAYLVFDNLNEKEIVAFKRTLKNLQKSSAT